MRNSQYFLKYSTKFREIFVRIGAKFDEKALKPFPSPPGSVAGAISASQSFRTDVVSLSIPEAVSPFRFSIFLKIAFSGVYSSAEQPRSFRGVPLSRVHAKKKRKSGISRKLFELFWQPPYLESVCLEILRNFVKLSRIC